MTAGVAVTVGQPEQQGDSGPGGWQAWHWVGQAVAWLVVLAVVAGFAWVQYQSFVPAYSEMDPDANITLGKRMARGESWAIPNADPFLYHGHMWVQNARGEILPKYDPGWPALMAVAYRIGGDEAIFWINPVLGCLGLVGAFLLFKCWMRTPTAVAGVMVLALNPFYVMLGGYLLGHTPEACFLTWGMWGLWRWMGPAGNGESRRTNDESSSNEGMAKDEKQTTRDQEGRTIGERIWGLGQWRKTALYGVAGGLALGFAGTIRHTAFLAGVMVLIALVRRVTEIFRGQGGRRAWWVLGALAGGYAVFPLLIAAYNWRFFGAPWTTGYALSREQLDFSWKVLGDNAWSLVLGLSTQGALVVWPLGLLAMLGVGTLWERGMRTLWVLGTMAVYGGYYWTAPDYISYRFFLGLLPALVGLTLCLLDRTEAGAPRPWPWWLWAGGALGLAVAAGLVAWVVFGQRGLALVELGLAAGVGLTLLVRCRCVMAAALVGLTVWWVGGWLQLTVHRGVVPRRMRYTSHQTITMSNFQNQWVVDLARGIDPVLQEDAVIFASSEVGNYLGTRRRYLLYRTEAFTTGYGQLWHGAGPFMGARQPRIQEERRAEIMAFYDSLDAGKLLNAQRERVLGHLEKGRQVAALMPAGGARRWEREMGVKTKLLKEIQTQRGAYGVYEVRIGD